MIALTVIVQGDFEIHSVDIWVYIGLATNCDAYFLVLPIEPALLIKCTLGLQVHEYIITNDFVNQIDLAQKSTWFYKTRKCERIELEVK